MKNPYLPQWATIIKTVAENPLATTLSCRLPEQQKFEFLSGQFMMVGLPGFGECPISISSDPRAAADHFDLTVRRAGELTGHLVDLRRGGKVLVRGPFGNGFPEVKSNLILIGGGCGFAPLKSVYLENQDRADIKIQIFFGCRGRDSALFSADYDLLKKKHDFNAIFETEIWPGYSQARGSVIDLLKQSALLPSAQVFICGPKEMYKPMVAILLKKKFLPQDIFLSLEKRMHCGVGVCQHCAIGSKYVCKDGPVFSLAELIVK